MKYLAMILFGMILSISAQAYTCNAVIKDVYGSKLENFSADSYSQDAACSEAMYQCNRSLSDARSSGRYYDANCEVDSVFNPYPDPNPYPRQIMCATDLVDQYGRMIRSFSGYGASEYEACQQSDSFCRDVLYRTDSFGARCITRRGPNPDPYPRNRSENCEARRFDPAGMFIQSYYSMQTGPMNVDVKAMACNEAMRQCQRDLKGRQFCNIFR